MKRWQTEIVARDLSKALSEMSQAVASGNQGRAEFWLEQALAACKAGLNRQHQEQIDRVLALRRQQRNVRN